MCILESIKKWSCACIIILSVSSCLMQIPTKKGLYSFYFFDTPLSLYEKEHVSNIIYPERYFIVDGVKELGSLSIIKVIFPKNKKYSCEVLSINDTLSYYKKIKRIQKGDIIFLDLIPVYMTESDNIAREMLPDSLRGTDYYVYSELRPEVWDTLINKHYIFSGYTLDADYNDGGLFTARNTVGGYLIEDGSTSYNNPSNFFIRSWDYTYSGGGIPSVGKQFKVYIKKKPYRSGLPRAR